VSNAQLFNQESKTGVGTLFTDDNGFVGVALGFGFHAKHLTTGALLRDWITELPGAAWNGTSKCWMIPDITDVPRGALKSAGFRIQHPDGSPARPSDIVRRTTVIEALPQPLNAVPDWFGYNVTKHPFEMQGDGALMIARGKNFLADDPGAGKTITALCSAAIMGSKRTLILCPPGVMEHWARSADKSGLSASVGGTVVVLKPTGKMPETPVTGVVVSSSSLVANRYELELMLAAWQPTVFIYDESHGSQTFSSKQARVMRRLSRSCTVSIPTSGSAALASPLELAAQLDIAGKLEPLFGPFENFRARYCRKTIHGYRPRLDRLDELGKILDESVWVRRIKVSKKIWKTQEADVDTTDYDESLHEIDAAIDEWLDEFREEHGRFPSNDRTSEFGDEVYAWCSGRGDMMSRLRQAAGLAKVPVALRVIDKHFAQHPQNADGTWPEPLIVWAHHHSVTEALMESATANGLSPKLIDGTVSTKKRTIIEDEFQAGGVGLLVCSIKAAGVGITLTRSYKSLFVEIDGTPAKMIQAADRSDRIGQTAESVLCKILVARGTVDERMEDILLGKSGVLEKLLGGNWQVAQQVNKKYSERILTSTILAEMVAKRLQIRVSA
jgi:hypothetical protein